MSGKCIIKNIVIGQGTPKICVPLMGSTKEDLVHGAKKILEAAKSTVIDIVEFRGDYFRDLNKYDELAEVMKCLSEMFSDIILLFTIRSEKEGGEKLSFTEPSVNEINKFVIENKLADIVDLELFSEKKEKLIEYIELAKKKEVKIIMSNHDFSKTPDTKEMNERLSAMQDIGADIAKIAVMPKTKEDVAKLISATTYMQENRPHTPVVTISMGKLGAITRISGQCFGSAITFSALKNASAPGQIDVIKMREILDYIDEICCDPDTV